MAIWGTVEKADSAVHWSKVNGLSSTDGLRHYETPSDLKN